MKRVEIRRKNWSRGNLGDNALLVSQETKDDARGQGSPLPTVGKMCCLGFICRALGATPEAIRGKALPSDVARVCPKLFPKLKPLLTIDHDCYMTDVIDNKKWVRAAARINDNATLTEKQRESRLRKLSAKHGFKLIFK